MIETFGFSLPSTYTVKLTNCQLPNGDPAIDVQCLDDNGVVTCRFPVELGTSAGDLLNLVGYAVDASKDGP